MQAIEIGDLVVAQEAIRGIARRTPLVRSSNLSERCRGEVYLKLEMLQETGAFKVRGAANRLLQMTPDERARGAIAFSTGNHGRGLAWVGRHLNMRVVICVPESVLPHKVAAIRALGAEVRVVGADQDRAELEAMQMAEAENLCWVSPFDDPWVIAGQGTIGLEIHEDLPQVDVVMAPLSGGGLLGGIALAMKSARRPVHTVGVSMERGPAMVASLAAGRPVPVYEEATLADSLVGGIGLDNHHTFDLVRRVVDETILVSEVEIAQAMVHAFKEEKVVAEGGGAVALAALLAGKINVEGKCVACVLSGGNVDLGKMAELLAKGAKAGETV